MKTYTGKDFKIKLKFLKELVKYVLSKGDKVELIINDGKCKEKYLIIK
jgi:hypothetical protein